MREELLHESPRSRIFLVNDEQEKGMVVLKMLNNDFPEESEITQFYNQADILDGLSLDGVRAVLSKTRIKNKHALKMEYFDGAPFKQIIDPDNIDVAKFLSIAIEVCDVLDNIHHAGIIHRDVNPSNILVNESDNAISFIDFEFSSRYVSRDYGLSVPTQLLGTIDYCSPEQTGRINRVVDQRSDLYSLGASFYEVLAGHPPFVAKDTIEVVHAHIAQVPKLLSHINSDVPLIIAYIVAKLLEKNSEDRYQSANGLKMDLERCLKDYEAYGEIKPFKLAQQDQSLEFSVAEKLYGRDVEIAEILRAFEETLAGSSQLFLVNGYSGTGKTSLVHEVHKPITMARGFYVEGKFDQFQKSVPYSGILQALSSLIDLILLEDENSLRHLTRKIKDALGDEGKVLTNLVPNLEILIGKQADIPDISGDDSRRRFNYIIDKFFSAVCDPTHPVVMFVDDIQWADAASLQLLQSLLTSESIKHFLWISAYRNNEVPSGHQLLSTISGLEAVGVKITNREVGNLSTNDVSHLIADALGRDSIDSDIAELTELIIEKTQGNAFFATRFIKSIEESGDIYYHRDSNQWRWNIDNIRAQNITDNVVEFLTSKLRTLSPSTQEVLKISSAFGSVVDVNLFDVIYSGDEAQRVAEFNRTKDEGLMTQASQTQLKFAHDRIVEATYSLLEKPEKVKLHRQIAKQLESNSDAKEVDKRLFEIVNHYNQALEHDDDSELNSKDKNELALLNYRAAVKAKTNSAFQLSLDYLQRAHSLLPKDSWQSQYSLSYDIHSEITDVSYLCGEYELTDQYFEIVDKQAKTIMERVRVYEVKINSYKANNDLTSAIDIGIEALQLLGKKLPRHPSKLQVMAGLAVTELRLKKISHEQILKLPDMDDEEQFAAMRIMVNLTPSAYWAEPNLLPILAFDLIDLSLKHGLNELSGYVFAGYGIILCGVLERMRRGQDYADLGLALSERFESKQWITQIVDPVYALILHWNKHVDGGLSPLRDSFYIGLETGENEFACVNANIYCTNSLLSGKPLPSLEKETETFSKSFLRLKQGTQFHYNEVYRQTMQCLMGNAENSSVLQGDAFDTKTLLPIKEQRKDKSGLFMIYFNQTVLSSFFGEYDQALSNAEKAMSYVEAVLSKFEIPNLYFYRSLAALKLIENASLQSESSPIEYDALSKKQKKKYLKIARYGIKKLWFYSRFAPENYSHKALILEAQLSLVQDRFEQSRDFLDRAIKKANEYGFVHEEALAYELGGKSYLRQDLEDLGAYYLTQAFSLYKLWGAQGKVDQLVDRYPKLLSLMNAQGSDTANQSNSASNNASPGKLNLDTETLVKASLSLSSEVELPKLLKTLMGVVNENAGARKGALILMRDGKPILDAILDESSGVAKTLLGQSLEDQDYVPISFIKYIARTKRSAIGNLRDDLQKFSQDDYFKSIKPESILGLPILNQRRLVGVLYLENELTKNVFTPQRVELLSVLSSQIAVSLDNAMLYQNLEHKVAERTKELAQEKRKSDELLANVLPKEVARELKEKGLTKPKHFDAVTVMFADFVGFTKASNEMSADQLVNVLDSCFKYFDDVVEDHGLEKIKTIGDSYMCAGGLPVANDTHALDTVAAAFDMLSAVKKFNRDHVALGLPEFQLRIGIHTGPLVAGVVGTKKFSYDIWGNTVNEASRIESHSVAGQINISEQTYQLVKNKYQCQYRGQKKLKHLGETNLYFVNRELN